ncbi:MAG: hypothetical protein ABR980_10720 [Ignavibacteriaceae bacterium]|jgi:hypothetical protein
MLDNNKYDFKILFDKVDETLKNENNIVIEIKTNQEIDEQIQYLKEFYDSNKQEEYAIVTRS